MKFNNGRKAVRLLALSVVAAMLAVTGAKAEVEKAASAAVDRGPIPANYFGMHFHHATEDTAWPDVGIGAWRLWDTYTAWPYLEPRIGQWTFQKLDKAVDIAQQHKVEILLTLGQSPTWAASRPQEKAPYGPGFASPPQDINDWSVYVRTVAQRYKGRIKYYELWNEPDLKDFFSGTPEQLADLTKAACKELRAVDPDIRIVSPSPTSGPWAFDFFRKYLKAMGTYSCLDVIGWHFYTTEDKPEKLAELVTKARALLGEFGLQSLPLWNTEAGYFVENPTGQHVAGTITNPRKLILDQDQAANFIARDVLMGWSFGLDRYYWYAWDNGKMGLLDLASRAPKPAVAAYRTVVGWMIGAKESACTSADGVWTCNLSRGGRTAYAVWSQDGSKSFSVPESWQAKFVEDLAGTARPLKNGTMEVTESPILFKADTQKW